MEEIQKLLLQVQSIVNELNVGHEKDNDHIRATMQRLFVDHKNQLKISLEKPQKILEQAKTLLRLAPALHDATPLLKKHLEELVWNLGAIVTRHDQRVEKIKTQLQTLLEEDDAEVRGDLSRFNTLLKSSPAFGTKNEQETETVQECKNGVCFRVVKPTRK